MQAEMQLVVAVGRAAGIRETALIGERLGSKQGLESQSQPEDRRKNSPFPRSSTQYVIASTRHEIREASPREESSKAVSAHFRRSLQLSENIFASRVGTAASWAFCHEGF